MKSRTLVGGRILVAVNMLAGIIAVPAAFTAGYEFATGTSATGVPAGLSLGSVQSGSGITTSVSGGRYVTSGWTTTAGRDLNDYFGFVVTVAANYSATLARLELDSFPQNGNTVSSWAIYSSRDNFSTALDSFTTTTANDVGVNLPAASFANLGPGTVEFRIYGFDAKNSNQSWSIDNLQLSGDLTAVPEPTHVALSIFGAMLAGGGLWNWRATRCRQ